MHIYIYVYVYIYIYISIAQALSFSAGTSLGLGLQGNRQDSTHFRVPYSPLPRSIKGESLGTLTGGQTLRASRAFPLVSIRD